MVDTPQSPPLAGGHNRLSERPSSFGLQQSSKFLGTLGNLSEEKLAQVDAYVGAIADPPKDTPEEPSYRYFSVRVKVDGKDSLDSDHKYPCGQEALKIKSNWDHLTLCTFLKTKWQDIQKGDIKKRVNIGLRSHWSDLHEVIEIKVPWAQDGDDWCSDPIEPMTITEDNCKQVLDMLKDVKVPKMLVVIAPRESEST